MRSDEGDQAQAWAVQYDDGMSLTTASEQIAERLAEAERQRGHRVTIRRLTDVETHPRGTEEPAAPGPVRPAEPFANPRPVSAPEPAPAPELTPAAEPASEAPPPRPARDPEPARVAVPAERRRLLLYVLAAVCVVVAAALAAHWNVLPRVGAGASPAPVGSPLHSPRLLPPLDQPPVTHFGH